MAHTPDVIIRVMKTASTLISILASLILLLGIGIRLYDITDEPLETHPTRQIRSAIISRAVYYEAAADKSTAEINFTNKERDKVGLIEPSILEWLTAQAYLISGQESPWLGRLFSIAVWVIGGLAIFDLASQIGSRLGAIFSLSYYLFLPFGVILSRTLMPDPMMVGLSVLAVWALYRWQKQQTGSYGTVWAAAAGLFTGAAILVKSAAAIILLPPFAFFILANMPIKKAVSNIHLWLILILTILPSAAYYFWGISIDGRLASQFGGRFFPELWTDLTVYKSWGKQIIQNFYLPSFLAGLTGIVLAGRQPRHRAKGWLLFGWWVGYFIYGVLFIYHIWTHSYYHLPMVPLLALSISPVIAAIESYVRKKDWSRQLSILLGAVLVIFISAGITQSASHLNETDYRQTRLSIEELGEYLKTAPDGKLVALTNDYETSFRFYTLSSTAHWPTSGEQSFKQLKSKEMNKFNQLWEEKTKDAGYFLVMDLDDIQRQTALAEKLSAYPVLLKTDLYILYDLIP